jgi:hypothetical protein
MILILPLVLLEVDGEEVLHLQEVVEVLVVDLRNTILLLKEACLE